MNIIQIEIKFLCMHLNKYTYYPRLHITRELLKFPEKNFITKQVQQFFGTINYIQDFIPNFAKLLLPSQLMLKKNPSPWNKAQTKTVVELKEVMQNLPLLQILSIGKRIL